MRLPSAHIGRAAVITAVAASAFALTASRVTAQDTGLSALPTGAKITVTGTPATGPATMSMSLPDGYTIEFHQHPTDESIHVTSGMYVLTFGDSTKTLSAGQRTTVKANTVHSERAQGPTVVEMHYPGPFKIIYTPAPKAASP